MSIMSDQTRQSYMAEQTTVTRKASSCLACGVGTAPQASLCGITRSTAITVLLVIVNLTSRDDQNIRRIFVNRYLKSLPSPYLEGLNDQVLVSDDRQLQIFPAEHSNLTTHHLWPQAHDCHIFCYIIAQSCKMHDVYGMAWTKVVPHMLDRICVLQ